MSVNLQPIEIFALSTRAQREQIIRDQHVSGSAEHTFKLLKQTQLALIEAKQQNSSQSQSTIDAIHAEEARLIQILNDNWYRNQTEGVELLIRNDLLILDRESSSSASHEIKSEEGLKALERFRERLNIQFNHFVQQLPTYATDALNLTQTKPSSIDTHELSMDSLLTRYKRDQGIQCIRQIGWEWLAKQNLSRSELTTFLNMLTQPTLSNIVDLVLRDLNEPIPTYNSSNPTREVQFGESALHRLLSFDQLHALKQSKPALWNNRLFVSDYILKNRPFVTTQQWDESDVNKGGLSLDVKRAYLEQVWNVAIQLPLIHLSIQGILMFHVLYYYMEMFNELDMKKLQMYLELPRSDSSSACLKYRSEEVVFGSSTAPKLTHAELLKKRTELFIPSSNQINCPSGIANIFTKYSASNESSLMEFALIQNLQSSPVDAAQAFNASSSASSYITNATESFKWSSWFSYLNESWSKRIIAREVLTNIALQNDTPSPMLETYKSYLGNDELNRLKNAIRIEFASRDKRVINSRFYSADSAVRLNILLKNVPLLLVKIFYVHARNFYTKRGEEIDASNLELDGLTPKEEMKIDCKSELQQQSSGSNTGVWNEFLVIEKQITLDTLSKETRGIFVVELLGAGYRARCIIRKGNLLALNTPTAQGHAFRIVDEETSTPINGSIYLNGQTYNSDPKTGFLLIPYSASPNPNQKIVLIPSSNNDEKSNDTTFATLSSFSHLPEQYTFSANFFVDRESLLSKTRASVLIKANLSIHNNSVNVERNLKNVVLRIDTTDDEDVPSTQIIDPFTLFADKDSVHQFTVPDNLKRIQFTLTGEVLKFSNGEKQSVSETYSLDFNTQDSTHFIEDVFLKYGSTPAVKGGSSSSTASLMPSDSNEQGEYVLYCLGKTGEPIRNRQLQISFQHEYINTTINGDFTDVTTDEDGCVKLGPLTHVFGLMVSPVGTSSVSTPSRHYWNLSLAPQVPSAAYVHAHRKRTLIIQAGETISIPYTGAKILNENAIKSGEVFYLVEDLGGNQLGAFLSPHHVELIDTPTNRSIQLKNMKAGHYIFICKQSLSFSNGSWHTWNIHVIQGKLIMNEFLIHRSENKIVQLDKYTDLNKTNAKLQIVDVSTTASSQEKQREVVIQLNGVTASTRVHVVSSNFYPDTSLLTQFIGSNASPSESRVYIYNVTGSSYLKQKSLGSEYEYILDRRLAGDRIGNTLPRPSLFLHERVKQDTQFSADPTLSAGESYSSADVAAAAPRPSAQPSFGAMAYGGAPPAGMAMMRQSFAPSVAAMRRSDYRVSSSNDDDGAASVGIVSFDGGDPHQRHNFEFLSQPSKLFANLRVTDAVTQTVRLNLSELDPTHNILSIIAVDSQGQLAAFQYGLKPASIAQYDAEEIEEKHTETNSSSLLKLDIAYRDSRLMPPLDSSKHYSEHHLITLLQSNESLVIDDVKTSTIETYDHLQDVWNLLNTLAKNTGEYSIIGLLQKFEWMLRWYTLSNEEQEAKYSEFACHELNLFLSIKDASFFKRVIKPFLQNKLSKTFMDLYLLDGDLSAFLLPHAFSVLNTLEKILLATRLNRSGGVENKAKAIAILDLIIQTTNATFKDDPDAFLAYFKTALQCKSLSKKSNTDDDAAADGSALLAQSGRENRAQRKEKAVQQQQEMQKEERELAPSRMRMMSKSAARPIAAAPSASMSRMAAPMMASMSAPPPPPGAPMRAKLAMAGLSDEAEMNCEQEEACGSLSSTAGGDFDSFADSLDQGSLQARKLFQEPPSTKEYEERTYYECSSSDLNEATELVRINRFWADYSSFLKTLWNGAIDTPPSSSPAFLTKHLGESLQTFTEVIARLIVLDLPLPSQLKPHTITGSREKSMMIQAGSPAIVFHKEMKQVVQENTSAATSSSSSSSSSTAVASTSSSSSASSSASNSISISSSYFDPFELFIEGSADGESERTDRFVSEFLTRKLYGCRVVLTNVSSNKQRVEVLLQIPSGSMSVGSNYKKGLNTTTRFVEIASYSSTVITYLFYFPTTGVYAHYPPSATKKGKSVGFGKPTNLRVVSKPTVIEVNLLDWNRFHKVDLKVNYYNSYINKTSSI